MRRLLRPEEWERLREPVKACFGQDKEPPDPTTTPLCAVEEDEDGNIRGFLFLQFVPHLEPFGSLGGVSFTGLKEVIDSAALTVYPNLVYYVHVDNSVGKEMLLSKGFTEKGILLEGKAED